MVYGIKQSKQVYFFGWQSMFIQISFINKVDFIIDYILV